MLPAKLHLHEGRWQICPTKMDARAVRTRVFYAPVTAKVRWLALTVRAASWRSPACCGGARIRAKGSGQAIANDCLHKPCSAMWIYMRIGVQHYGHHGRRLNPLLRVRAECQPQIRGAPRWAWRGVVVGTARGTASVGVREHPRYGWGTCTRVGVVELVVHALIKVLDSFTVAVVSANNLLAIMWLQHIDRTLQSISTTRQCCCRGHQLHSCMLTLPASESQRTSFSAGWATRRLAMLWPTAGRSNCIEDLATGPQGGRLLVPNAAVNVASESVEWLDANTPRACRVDVNRFRRPSTRRAGPPLRSDGVDLETPMVD